MALDTVRIEFTHLNFAVGAQLLMPGYHLIDGGLYDIQVVVYNVAAIAGDWTATLTLDRTIPPDVIPVHFEPTAQILSAGTLQYKAFPLNSILAWGGDKLWIHMQSPNAADSDVDGHVLIAQRSLAFPVARPGAAFGLPTVDANNRIVGIQGTVTTLDGLNTPRIQPGVAYNAATDTLSAVVVVTRNGVTLNVDTSVSMRLYTAAGVAVWTAVNLAEDANNVWAGTKSPSGMTPGSAYYLHLIVVHNGSTYTLDVPVAAVP